MPKPFSPRELAARVRAVLRRMPERALERGSAVVKQGPLTLDFVKREVSVDGKIVSLTTTEFKLLGTMAREPGKIFNRADLINKALGHDADSFEHTIDTHIMNLRRKLEADPSNPKYIVTVFGTGYRFAEGDVR